MAKILGLGGVFFKSPDPTALATWYKTHLGMPIDIENPTYGVSFQPADFPAGGYNVWSPFDNDTKYLDPSDKSFMFNLIVDDVDEALKQVVAGGCSLVGTPEDAEYGKFGWFIDPDGNKVELWQPPTKSD